MNHVTVSHHVEVHQMADLFKSFSDAHRLQILLLLLQGETSVGQLANRLNHQLSAVSHQLKHLHMARLVSKRRQGKQMMYSLLDDHVKQLLLVAEDHIQEKERKGD